MLYNELNLHSTLGDTLPDPPEADGKPREEVVPAVSALHADNPANRSVERLERFLDRCPELTETEVYGIVGACVGGPKMTRASAVRGQIAIVRYLVRTVLTSDYFPHRRQKDSID